MFASKGKFYGVSLMQSNPPVYAVWSEVRCDGCGVRCASTEEVYDAPPTAHLDPIPTGGFHYTEGAEIICVDCK